MYSDIEMMLTTEEQAELESSTYEELEARLEQLLNDDEDYSYEFI